MRKLRLKVKRTTLKRLRRQLPAPRDMLLVAMGVMLAFIGIRLSHMFNHAPKPLGDKGGITISWLPDTVKRWQQPLEAAGKKYDIDPNLLAIIMTMESGGNPKAHSGSNAQGLMQVTPPTAEDIAHKFLKETQPQYDLYDGHTSIEFGAAYLAYLRDTFGSTQQGPDWNGTVELIAAGYNGGPGAASSVKKGEGLHDMQTVAYSRDAYNMWRERNAGQSPTFQRWSERGGNHLVDAAKAN